MPTPFNTTNCSGISLTKKNATDRWGSILNATCKAADGTTVTSSIDLNSNVGVKFTLTQDGLAWMKATGTTNTYSHALCPNAGSFIAGLGPGVVIAGTFPQVTRYPVDGTQAASALATSAPNWVKFASQTFSGTTVGIKITGTLPGSYGGTADCGAGTNASSSLDLGSVIQVGDDGKLVPTKAVQLSVQAAVGNTFAKCTGVTTNISADMSA
eukprot:tig00020560_g11068.t1